MRIWNQLRFLHIFRHQTQMQSNNPIIILRQTDILGRVAQVLCLLERVRPRTNMVKSELYTTQITSIQEAMRINLQVNLLELVLIMACNNSQQKCNSNKILHLLCRTNMAALLTTIIGVKAASINQITPEPDLVKRVFTQWVANRKCICFARIAKGVPLMMIIQILVTLGQNR